MIPDCLIGKNCYYIKILAVVLATFSSASSAAWILNSPPGAAVTDFALAPSNPAIVLATTAGANLGIWTSPLSGNGTTWDRKFVTPGYNGAAIKADNFNFMLAGILGGEIEVSADGFELKGPTIGSAIHTSWIIEYSLTEFDTVYAAGYTSALSSGTLQKSVVSLPDVVWVSYPIGGDPNPPTFSLAIAPTDADTVYVGAQPDAADNGLYKTTDGAVSWSYLSALSFTQVDAVAVDPVDRDYVYAGSEVSGLIQRSSDGGVTWVIVHDPLNGGVTDFISVRGLAINPADRRIIYAVGGSGTTKVIVSTDCGVTWANVDATGLVSGLPDKVVIDPMNNYVMVRTGTGFMYREALLTTATGDCRIATRSSGNAGALDSLLLGMLLLIGIVGYRNRHRCCTAEK